MDVTDYFAIGDLYQFFRSKKTEMSCMEKPELFLNHLCDHDLVEENLCNEVIQMRSEEKVNGVYEVLKKLQDQPQIIKTFWSCIFKKHMLQKYPTLQELYNELNSTSLIRKDQQKVIMKPQIFMTPVGTCGGLNKEVTGNDFGSNWTKSVSNLDMPDYYTIEDLYRFFRSKKTEMSCMEKPEMFLNHLCDHDLVEENLCKEVMQMSSEEKVNGLYQVFQKLQDQPQSIKTFWSCIFKKHMLQKYPTLQELYNELDNISPIKKDQQKITRKQPIFPSPVQKHLVLNNEEADNGEHTTHKLDVHHPVSDGEAYFSPGHGNTSSPVHADTTFQLAGLKGPAADDLVPDTTAHVQASSGVCGLMELRLGDVTTQGCDNSELTTAEHEMETFIPPVEDDCIDLGTGWSAFCQTPPVSDNERCVTYEELDKTTSKKRKKSESSEENEEEDEQPGPSSQATSPQEQKAKKSVRFSSFLKEQQEDICKGHLCVTCGDKEGTLCREKFAKGAKCILAEGRWFTPTEFEEFGGRKSSKNWKTSIRFKGKMLLVLIQEGHLNAPSRGTFQSARRSLFNIKYESETDEKEDDSCEEEDQGMGEPLSVQCGSVTAKLYKFRFASGSKGKSIRTERCWLTPSEFVQQESSITDSKWTKHILCNTRPLKYLIKKKVLQVHSALCNCELCSSENQHLLEQENDDWCLVCGRDGELVCCDTCPRSFHGLCHISRPSGGDNKWSCTFCLVENNQKDQITEQQALGRPISEYMNECQALLMKLLSEDKQRNFTPDPSTTVERHTGFIEKPMWLERVKLNLHSGEYELVREFVSDVRLIFENCATFNKNNEFGRMGAQLSTTFEEEFRHLFKIQSSPP